MKKLISCMLILILTLLAGCGAAPVETTQAAEAPALTEAPGTSPAEAPAGPVSVATVDEFLAALDSDTEILLAPGEYNLTTASDYGELKTDSPYTWVPTYDGYELRLENVMNLTIRGDSKDTTALVTEPRLSNVLAFENCAGISLEGFTAGHTDGGEMCSGGVIFLAQTEEVGIRDMGLYGCGTIGVEMAACRLVTVSGCDIYDCSVNGIKAYGSEMITVENTAFHDLGTDAGYISSVFSLENDGDVYVSGCTVSDNVSMNLLDISGSENITFAGNLFRNNRTVEGAFRFLGTDVIFEDNQLEDNTIRVWYTQDSLLASDSEGNAVTVPEVEPQAAAPAGDRKEVRVSTVDEFLAAIDSNTQIVLEGEIYDLSTAADYGKGKTDHYFWTEEFDGPELVITGVENFGISSASGDHTAHTISATPRYADVLTFQHSRDISLSGFTAGHTKEPGSCAGGVLYFDDDDNITIEDCGLFGCGIIGINANYCGNIQVTDCDIYECSQGGIAFYNVSGGNIDNTTIRDMGEGAFDYSIGQSENVFIDGQPYESR